MWPFQQSGYTTTDVAPAPSRSTIELVKQIHEEFDTASERMVELAKSVLAQALSARAVRMSGLGLYAQPEVVSARVKSDEKRVYRYNTELVARYAERYPGYKFITRDDVRAIAKKYGLVLGDASRFIGYIPEQNLREMEAIRIDAGDVPIVWRDALKYEWGPSSVTRLGGDDPSVGIPNSRSDVRDVSGFHVVAPLKDFKTDGAHVENNVLFVPDPVVLKPVVGGYLIVTKWGPEAEIEELK